MYGCSTDTHQYLSELEIALKYVSSSHYINVQLLCINMITLFYSKTFFLRTHAVDTISSVARIAGTGVISHCVSAVCILMTVVQVITLAFIDICIEHKLHVSLCLCIHLYNYVSKCDQKTIKASAVCTPTAWCSTKWSGDKTTCGERKSHVTLNKLRYLTTFSWGVQIMLLMYTQSRPHTPL